MSTEPAPRKMPDSHWMMHVIGELGYVAATVNGKGDLLQAMDNFIAVMKEWRADVVYARRIAKLTPEAKRRIARKIGLDEIFAAIEGIKDEVIAP